MLIASHRHRPDDLRLWAEMEEADRLHGLRLIKSDRMKRSVTEMRRFASLGPCHLCFSGGKDSAALLGLAEIAGLLTLPAVWFCAMPKHHPEVPVTIAAIENRLNIVIDVVTYDSPVPFGLTSLQAEEIAGRNFLRACREYQKQHGRRVLGVRANESRARKIKMCRWGLATGNSCTPIGWWTAADVFAFLAVRDLPVNPVYAMMGGGRWPRERLRIDALMGERGDGLGRAEWEREYYGDVLRGFEAAAFRAK